MSARYPGTAVQSRSKTGILPSGFVSIRAILDGQVAVGRFASVFGLVKDFRLPMPTNGSDYKSALTIYDKSTEEDGADLLFNIFRPEQEIPRPSAGDVVVIYSAKVQSFRDQVSLLSNRTTDIHVWAASRIPRPPKGAMAALEPPARPKGRLPVEKEHEYVSWLYHGVDKSAVPDAAEFEVQVQRSAHVRDKFRPLKDVRDSQFCDIIAQVVKEPYDLMDKITLWVTDYTENDGFYKFSWDASDLPTGRDGDPYGYTTTRPKESGSWPGPFGKRSMQITCWEPHATTVRTEVKGGDWVKLRNVQVKFGHNANNLEGYLREDQGSYYRSERRVDILDTADKENADDRLKEAVRRKRDHTKMAKQQKQSYAANEIGNGADVKRKQEDEGASKMNSKKRRQAARSAAQAKEKEKEHDEKQKGQKQKEVLGLNALVKCESLDEPAFTISQILEPVPYTATIGGEEAQLTLPFNNAKYRANVRVVDFRPLKLENFAAWRKNTELDLISNSGDSDSESGEDQGTLDMYAGEKTWEWRFALQLEEADSTAPNQAEPKRLWVVVDNFEAQGLIGLDALDLRANPDNLLALREQLFKLWGNLEEQKVAEEQQQIQSRMRVALHQPPPSSDEESSEAARTLLSKSRNQKEGVAKVSNKPFSCCIRQYGVKVREDDPSKANAGDGKRWERMFGLFGTKICL